MKNTYRKAIILLAISLSATNSYATISYMSEGDLSVEVSFRDSTGNIFDYDALSDITLSYSDNFSDDDYTTSVTGDAFSDGVTSAFSGDGLIEIDTQASGYAGSPYAYAQSDATASASLFLENISTATDYFVDLLVSYSFSGSVETDRPLDEQNGEAFIDIYLFGDYSLGDVLAISELTNLDGLFSGGSNSALFSFELLAGDSENIYAGLYSYGESESVSAAIASVPLPAPILLMGAPLLALLIRRRTATT